jgi:dTDP-4-amino-4,6-dideoxygalactose transaminase
VIEMSERLAIRGGPPAVKEDHPEVFKWPVYGEEELQAIKELFEGEDVYSVIGEFERDFGKYIGAKYVLAHNNGTSSIHSALFAVGVGPGDEVIVPSYSWMLNVVPILASHAIPVFCDIDPRTLTADPEDIRKRITPRTKAMIVVHLYGHPADMDPIMEVARERGIAVIEDCSHAHGAEYKGRKVGTIGDIGCFSMQASKLLPAIEGGVLVTNNEEYYERAVLLGHYERVPSLKNERYRKLAQGIKGAIGLSGVSFGYKYRIHPVAAAIARVQLKRLDERLEVRRRNMEYISKGLSELEAVEPPYVSPHVKLAWYMYLPRYHRERARNVPKSLFVEALRAEGVRAKEEGGYRPFHTTNFMQLRDLYGRGCPWRCPHVEKVPEYALESLPVTESIPEKLFSLAVLKNPAPKGFMDSYIEAFHKVERNTDQLVELAHSNH